MYFNLAIVHNFLSITFSKIIWCYFRIKLQFDSARKKSEFWNLEKMPYLKNTKNGELRAERTFGLLLIDTQTGLPSSMYASNNVVSRVCKIETMI